MDRSIVLLRGINVGGHNKVPMAELRTVLSDAGYAEVATYIQSGNIGLSTSGPVSAGDITGLLRNHFDVDVPVVVTTPERIREVQNSDPFGADLDPKFVHTFFLDEPIEPGDVEFDAERFAPDEFVATPEAVFVHYRDGVATSKLTVKVVEKATGRTATARNRSTLAKLVDL